MVRPDLCSRLHYAILYGDEPHLQQTIRDAITASSLPAVRSFIEAGVMRRHLPYVARYRLADRYLHQQQGVR